MKRIRSLLYSGLLAMALAGGLTGAAEVSAPRTASTATAAKVHIDDAWIRAAPPGATMLAGYMVVHNDGKTPQRFLWADSDAFGMVELHRSALVNGMETMRPAGDQTIAPGASLSIAPGGLHLMLMQPKRDLKIGDKVRLRLHFADGGAAEVITPVSSEAPAPHR